MKITKLVIYTDGGARGNPGPGAAGAAIYDEQRNMVAKEKVYLGTVTNNQAEYQGVILGLTKAKELSAKELTFYLDSELVVKQLNGEYRVKNHDLSPLFVKIWNLRQSFDKVFFFHIRREENKVADRLVNEAIDDNFNNK